ncbi:MAG: translocation/assembly module TamB domain-containing protein [Prevotella sp.]|nr:translocation/assembly module TamB domain-containing protein [Prevotella sp.]
MKKAFWWILGILLSPVLLFLILTLLLYFPPVQNWAVDKVAAIASEKTGMQITVDHVDLSFPLDLGIDGFHIIQQSDTIADVERMIVDVKLMPLFKKKVIIEELEVNNAKFNTAQFVEAARVKGQFKRLALSSKGIDLDKQTVEVNGACLEDARVDIALNDSVPEDTTTTENHWKIFADSLSIIRSDVAFHMPGDTMSVAAHFGSLVAREGDIDLETQTYKVASLDWENGSLQYDLNFEPRVEGLDFNHIDLTHVNIGVDSIYYHNPTARLVMRTVQMREKSGLQVTDLTGAIAMENGKIRLPSFRLRTPDSDIEMELDMPFSLMDKIDPGKMRMRMNAQLGKQDLMRFMGGMPQSFQQRWPNYPLSVKGSVNGNMDYMEFDGLDVSLPTAFHATATGFAANLTDPKRLRAKVQFKARTEDLGFITGMLPKDIQRDYRIPRGITAEGLVRADGAQYFADVVMREGKGVVKAKGNFNADAMRYDAKLNIRDLNVHHFMPHDSIYTVSADIVAKGQGTDIFSPRTTLVADAKIHHIDYGSYHLNNMTATADVRNGRAYANLTGDNELLNGTISLDALTSKDKLNGTVTADLAQLDLYRLHLVDKPLTIGLCGHVDVKSDFKKTHYISGFISDLTFRDSAKVYRPEDVGVLVNLRPDTTYARIQSGDFIVKVDASGDYERVLKQLTVLSDSAMAQLDQKVINQPALRRLLPVMKLHVESKANNPIANILKSGENIEFKDLLFDMSTSPETGVNGQGYVHSLVYDGTRLDTINFRLTQRAERLSFGGQIRNNKRNPQFVFNALFDGVLQEKGATMGVRYYDSDNKLGARIGAQAEMAHNGINLHLVPDRPTLGYKEFNLNKDNFVFLGTDKKVRAKIDLIADDGTGVKIYSEESDPTALQDITVSLNRFNLDEITSVIPYVPRMSGLLNGDYHVVQHESGHFSMVSDMSVQNMTYEHSPIGNISTELVYLQKEDDAHAIEARLMKDDIEVGLLNGTYYNAGDGSLDANLQLERFPLSIINGFVPDQIAGLEGYGEGNLSIKGSLKKPQVNGEIYLDSSYLVSIPYGMRLRFDNDPVRIVGSNLLLENFTVYAHNDNPLNIMGSVNFSDLDRIMVDLRMQARDYQIIGAKENAKSIAYGKAFVDFFGRMQGPLDNLSMRGRLNVLGSTDMSYVLRDTPLSTDNHLEELVKFVDFNDTIQAVVNRPTLTGFNMDLTMEISKGAHIMAYLNTDHSNYIDLMGGGTLRMLYTPADNLQLRGRYTLSNGEMKYSLPVIPLKTFTIQDGSYIEFTGEPMNPTLNITATERTRATVSNDNGVGRSVEFDCGVIITKTLNDMGLEFTLDAPEDMQLHSELQAMGTEQRGKLAVTMLTTGMYLADGNTGAFSMNSALSSFLNSEISNITGNALRTLDLSFGMDNSVDASGATHTDYSFKFAKRFMNNRLKIAVGGKVSTGAELQQRNNSFFDNVSLEYRLDQTANKFITLYYQNNSYDWLDGYTQKYGAGFTWRRSLQSFWDIFRFKDTTPQMPLRNPNTPSPQNNQNIPNTQTTLPDSLKTESNETK